MEPCFRALLAWIVGSWSGRQMALALDATTLGDQFVVLAISVVYRGCAVPVAAHAWIVDGRLRLVAAVAISDGTTVAREAGDADPSDGVALARDLASRYAAGAAS